MRLSTNTVTIVRLSTNTVTIVRLSTNTIIIARMSTNTLVDNKNSWNMSLNYFGLHRKKTRDRFDDVIQGILLM